MHPAAFKILKIGVILGDPFPLLQSYPTRSSPAFPLFIFHEMTTDPSSNLWIAVLCKILFPSILDTDIRTTETCPCSVCLTWPLPSTLVDHDLMMLKLERQFGHRSVVLDWFRSYLCGRTYRVIHSHPIYCSRYMFRASTFCSRAAHVYSICSRLWATLKVSNILDNFFAVYGSVRHVPVCFYVHYRYAFVVFVCIVRSFQILFSVLYACILC